MNAINGVMRGLVGAALAPFAGLPPIVALLVLSAVLGVLAAIVFRYTSPQRALRRVADQVRANLLAMRLFSDDLLVTFRTQGGLLKASFLRLAYSLPPLFVLIVPFVLILAQLAMYYEFRPLRPGEAALVSVQVQQDRWAALQELTLEPPEGVQVEARVRDGSSHTITWRIRPQRALDDRAVLRWAAGSVPTNGGEAFAAAEKRLCVAEQDSRLMFANPVRPGTGFWDRLLYPGEPAFAADSPVQKITISYAPRSGTWLGMSPWLWTFFVVSIVAALLSKPIVKVQF